MAYDLKTSSPLSSVSDGSLMFGAASNIADLPSTFSLATIKNYLSQFFLPAYYYGVRAGASDIADGLDAMIAAGYTTVQLAPGTYNLPNGYAKSGVNSITIASAGAYRSATIVIGGDNTGFHLTTCAFWRFSGISVTRQAGSTAGDAFLFDGTSSSNTIEFSYIAGHKGRGIAFVGTSGASQSGNDVLNNIIIDNDGGGIHYVYSHDNKIVGNEIGKVSSATYPTFGVKLDHSSEGQLSLNMMWDNVQDVVLDTCSDVGIVGGRIEEARQEGIYGTGCTDILISSVRLHTHSKSSSGTYDAVKFLSSTGIGIVANNFRTWNATQVAYSVNLDTATANASRIVGNMFKGYATAPYTIGSATGCIVAGNDPIDAWRTIGTDTRVGSAVDTVQSPGATTDVTYDANNPSTTSFAGQQQVHRVAGSARVSYYQQRADANSGDQHLLQVADSGGSLRTRHLVTQDGHHSFAAAATFVGSTGTLSEGTNATVSRGGTGLYTITASTSGTLPANSHVFAGGTSADPLTYAVTARSTSAVTVQFYSLSGGSWVTTDPTSVWVHIL